MTTAREHLNDLKAELEQQRDELRVKLNLGQAEAREEWEKVEHRWEQVKAKLDSIGDEAADVAEDVGDAAKLLLAEIRDGYKRLRKLI